MIDLPDSLDDQLVSAMHTAAGERRDVQIPYGEHTHNTVKAYAYRIRRELGYKHVVQISSETDYLVIKPYKVPEHVVAKPTSTAGKQAAVAANQVITKKVPTDEQLAAYRILIDGGILDCVEILDYTKERFESDFPGVKAFMLENTRKGVLLL